MKKRGFEIAKGWEDKDIHIPVRKTAHAAAYDIEAAEDITIPIYKPGIKPTLIPTGLKAYCMDDECYFLISRSGGPKKGLLTPHGFGLIDADYYENPDNDGEIGFMFYNFKDEPVVFYAGDKLGQGIFEKYYTVSNEEEITSERTGGFGSTGN